MKSWKTKCQRDPGSWTYAVCKRLLLLPMTVKESRSKFHLMRPILRQNMKNIIKQIVQSNMCNLMRRFRSSCSWAEFHLVHTLCSIQWFCRWTVKALIRLCKCAGWSWHSLPAFAKTRFCMARPMCLMLILFGDCCKCLNYQMTFQ